MTARRGAALALVAAGAFGASSPLVKRFAPEVPALVASGLLYLGCGLALLLVGLARATPREARLRGGDFGWRVLVAASGRGARAARVPLLGRREQPTSRMQNARVASLGLVAPGGVALAASAHRAAFALAPCRARRSLRHAPPLTLHPALAHRIAHRDPFAIVRWKGLVAGPVSLGLAAATGRLELPGGAVTALLLAVGAVSYGASIVLYTYAQRGLGAGRTAAYYGLAPFIGALLALALGEPFTAPLGFAALAMAGGAFLLLREQHGHTHTHEALAHEHRHSHDEHHRHAHPGDEGPEPHAHPHVHEPLEHDHEHAPDLHHRHEHGA